MMDVLIIPTALMAFIATNLDDLFLLAAFFAHPDYSGWSVVLGQLLGFTILVMISSLAYFTQLVIPIACINLMGIIPIIIGVKNILKWLNNHDVLEKPERQPSSNQIHYPLFAVSIVTVANGGDNLGVYIPLFALMNPYQILITFFLFLAMMGLWCLIGFGLVKNHIIGTKIQEYGHLMLPFILIIVGIMILIRGLGFNTIL